MSQRDPIRVYVTHLWEESDDYLRVFEYLESARNFYYLNLSTPGARPGGDKEKRRESFRGQMANAEVVLALASLYAIDREMLTFQLLYAQAVRKPVVLARHFGGPDVALPPEIADLADVLVDWDERALVDAIRRAARHEETNRWDVIEFKLD
jgi:hypothetical protein